LFRLFRRVLVAFHTRQLYYFSALRPVGFALSPLRLAFSFSSDGEAYAHDAQLIWIALLFSNGCHCIHTLADS
jgi:hypothetical protein